LLLGFDYRPQLADLPDAKLWMIDVTADYGPLALAARGRIDLARVRQHWGDVCRLVASIHTGAVSAHDVIRMLAPGSKTTQLGDALAHYGRIFKTMHVLAYVVDDEAYRRQIKGMRPRGTRHRGRRGAQAEPSPRHPTEANEHERCLHRDRVRSMRPTTTKAS